MYAIDKEPYGYRLIFAGDLSEAELQIWLDESHDLLERQRGSFHVFVDMRNLIPLSREAQRLMLIGQKAYRSSGMDRSVVIVHSPVLLVQFQRLAGDSGIHENERYIDASLDPYWEEHGLDWLLRAIEPARRTIPSPLR